MDSYNFTYKDVLKRYERIINKPSKFEIRLLATILFIITIVNITSLCFANDVEEVNYNTVENLGISNTVNYFFTSDTPVGYFPIENGYIYHIKNTSGFQRRLALSNSVPAVNVTYDFLVALESGATYSYIGDGGYLFFDFDPGISVSVTREPITGYSSAVSDLVENVGISQLWDVFDTGIGFVGVVVIAAFGIFLIVLAIRKMQKGKSDF